MRRVFFLLALQLCLWRVGGAERPLFTSDFEKDLGGWQVIAGTQTTLEVEQRAEHVACGKQSAKFSFAPGAPQSTYGIGLSKLSLPKGAPLQISFALKAAGISNLLLTAKTSSGTMFHAAFTARKAGWRSLSVSTEALALADVKAEAPALAPSEISELLLWTHGKDGVANIEIWIDEFKIAGFPKAAAETIDPGKTQRGGQRRRGAMDQGPRQ